MLMNLLLLIGSFSLSFACISEYPGDWEGSVERVETLNDLIVTVVNVYPKGRNASFHVVSFIKTKEDKIVSMDEYWADDGNAPQWRLDKHIGKAIR